MALERSCSQLYHAVFRTGNGHLKHLVFSTSMNLVEAFFRKARQADATPRPSRACRAISLSRLRGISIRFLGGGPLPCASFLPAEAGGLGCAHTLGPLRYACTRRGALHRTPHSSESICCSDLLPKRVAFDTCCGGSQGGCDRRPHRPQMPNTYQRMRSRLEEKHHSLRLCILSGEGRDDVARSFLRISSAFALHCAIFHKRTPVMKPCSAKWYRCQDKTLRTRRLGHKQCLIHSAMQVSCKCLTFLATCCGFEAEAAVELCISMVHETRCGQVIAVCREGSADVLCLGCRREMPGISAWNTVSLCLLKR